MTQLYTPSSRTLSRRLTLSCTSIRERVGRY